MKTDACCRGSRLLMAGAAVLALAVCAQAETVKKKVGVTIVKTAAFEEKVKFPATVFAKDDVVLGAEVPGRVSRLGVDEGDAVGKGDKILSVDAETYEAALRAAEADLELARKEEERGSRLVKDAVISTNDYDALSARRKAAQAAFDVARINLEKAIVRAPFAGVVDRIMLEDGAQAGVGDPAARMINLDTFEVRCFVPEKDIAFIRPGAAVSIRHKALGLEKQGSVVFAARAADVQSMSFPVKIQGANTEPMFLAGMIVEAEFVRRRLDNVVSVPLFCVMQDSGGTFCYVEKQGGAARRDVVVGGVDNGFALIMKGLEPGDRLISTGQRGLDEGDLVEVAGEE